MLKNQKANTKLSIAVICLALLLGTATFIGIYSQFPLTNLIPPTTGDTVGVVGPMGPIGPIGPAGPTGATGPAGPAGADGADAKQPLGAYSYLIYVSDSAGKPNATGGYYSAQDGLTGNISWTSTNGTYVIQTSMDSLTVGRTQKETVLLKGSFTLNTKLLIPSYTKIVIDGVINAGNTLNDTLIENSVGHGVESYTDPVSRNYDIEITGGTINGNKAASTAWSTSDDKCTIHMKGVEGLSIHDVTMLNGWTENIRTAFVSQGVISNNLIDNSTDDGIAINSESSFISVVGNTILNSGQGITYGTSCGIEVQDGSHHISVSGNTISNSAADGIQVEAHETEADCYHISVTGNTIDCMNNTGSMGIRVGATGTSLGYGVVVSGNSVSRAQNSGIYIIAGVDPVQVTGNIVTNSQHGITLTTLDSNIEGNTCYNNTGYGIQVTSAANYNNIVGNSLMNNDIGIANNGDNNNIVGNTFAKSATGITQRYGIYFYNGGDNNEVKSNSFYGHTVAAIGITATNQKIFDNMGYNPKGYITNPFSGSLQIIVDAGNNATMTSEMTYTNWQSPKTIYVSGGTVTAITVNGQATGLVNGTVTLYPADTFSVTFSSEPTLKVMGQ